MSQLGDEGRERSFVRRVGSGCRPGPTLQADVDGFAASFDQPVGTGHECRSGGARTVLGRQLLGSTPSGGPMNRPANPGGSFSLRGWSNAENNLELPGGA